MLPQLSRGSILLVGPWGGLRPICARWMCSDKGAITSKNNPESVFYEGPERDLVNFPRRKRPIEKAPVRYGFIPEEWFSFFHPKTGVTGPYMFAFSLSTYLFSKEIFVIEADFFSGLAFWTIVGGAMYKFGPATAAYANKLLDEREAKLKSMRMNEIDLCQKAIENEEKSQWMATSWEQLIQAKKDNVALQLEAAYRQRLQDAYVQVKQKLDFQSETANVMRRTEQKHMVDWIIGNVRKSITPKLEEDALKKCLTDLKSLAATAH